jgi:hypothetical protein
MWKIVQSIGRPVSSGCSFKCSARTRAEFLNALGKRPIRQSRRQQQVYLFGSITIGGAAPSFDLLY